MSAVDLVAVLLVGLFLVIGTWVFLYMVLK